MSKKPQFGSIYRRGRVWWVKYYKDGRPFYESSESQKSTEAQRLLEQRRAEIYAGTHLDSTARRITVGELLDDLVRDYKINAKDHKWAEMVVRCHLQPPFGAVLAARLKASAVERYIELRQESGAANATINRALALLHRAFTLGRKSGKVGVLPVLPQQLKENNTRKGFFEREEFLAVRNALPEEIKPLVTFAYWTGCRKGEILGLHWSQVDLLARVVRLEPGETKNDEARTIPLAGELYEMLAMQRAIRDQQWPACPWVFSRHGQPIKKFRRPWDAACRKAGLWEGDEKTGKPAKLFHDLRRTGVRNLIRAGVPERVAMAISGHKSRSVFDRYNIVSESDLHEAARRLNLYVQSPENQAECDRDGDNLVTVEPKSEAQAQRDAAKLLN
jgi:integrase